MAQGDNLCRTMCGKSLVCVVHFGRRIYFLSYSAGNGDNLCSTVLHKREVGVLQFGTRG